MGEGACLLSMRNESDGLVVHVDRKGTERGRRCGLISFEWGLWGWQKRGANKTI